MECVRLTSGNIFIFFPSSKERIATAAVLKPEYYIDTETGEQRSSLGYTFVGGYAGREAIRKRRIFYNMPNTRRDTIEDVDMTKVDFIPFLSTLGRIPLLFRDYMNVEIDDSHATIAGACNQREYYFNTVGLEDFYDHVLKCPLWAIIGNHLSVFSYKNFSLTFDNKSTGTPEAVWQELSVFLSKHKYAKRKFITPAYYLLSAGRKLYKV